MSDSMNGCEVERCESGRKYCDKETELRQMRDAADVYLGSSRIVMFLRIVINPPCIASDNFVFLYTHLRSLSL